jgi:hypothetical protein
LLQDPETLRTYEDFAREAAYEKENTQPQASNPPTRRAHRDRSTPHSRTQGGGNYYGGEARTIAAAAAAEAGALRTTELEAKADPMAAEA